MTYGPPPEPNASAAQPDAAAPDPNVAYSVPPPSQGPMAPYPHPQQPWSNPYGPGWPGGPPPVNRPMEFGPAVAAVILGLLGCVLPFLTINMRGVTEAVTVFIPFPFALPGVVLAIVGCTKRRRGQSLAAVGAILSFLALAIGAAMIVGHARNGLL